jgi:hypothetical protein
MGAALDTRWLAENAMDGHALVAVCGDAEVASALHLDESVALGERILTLQSVLFR